MKKFHLSISDVFAVPNAALLAFNASNIVHHDQDQQQGDVAQNDAVPNAQGEIKAHNLLPLLMSTRLLLRMMLSSSYSIFMSVDHHLLLLPTPITTKSKSSNQFH
jgi:hypothetical protein